MKEVNFEIIHLKEITPDPNQPRKFYDESSMHDLRDSIIACGVIEPIIVRKKQTGKGYLLVCGERRFRASILADQDTIPSIVRELTDEEALHMQIIENLHRKDVHPMEEAVAFRSFIDGKNWSHEEIAKRVGKSEFYVRQRLKLCNLMQKFQELYFHNKMNNTTALRIAAMDHQTQESVFNDHVDEEDLQSPRFELSLSQWQLDRYAGNLNQASFDIADDTLLPSAGACNRCQFNTGVMNLFPDDDKSARCNNLGCYKQKSDINYKRQLEQAKEDPTIMFVNNQWNVSPKEIKVAKAAGVEFLENRHAFKAIDVPEPPDFAEFRENLDDGDYNSEQEMREAYDKEVQEYENELKEYHQKIASGKYKKAFVLNGDHSGAYIYIETKSSGTAKKSLSSSTEQPGTEEQTIDIDAEISRLKEKEKRSKEIDENKMWDELKSQFNPSANASILKDEFSDLERKAIATALYNKLNYPERDNFQKLFKIDRRAQEFPEISETTFRQMCRFFMLDVLPPSLCYSGLTADAKLSIQIAEEYFPNVLKEIQDTTKAKADKRIAKVNKRIKELQAMKKESKKSAKQKK